jgi:uncharacterized membrane protein
MSNFFTALTLVALTASGIVGGTFFVFSTTIMQSLSARPEKEAIAVMREINAVIVRTFFIAVFLGNAIACVVLIISGALDTTRPGVWLVISGAVFYLVGSFLVTIVFNVPRNNALADVSLDEPTVYGPFWKDYLAEWTWWNHIRTAACILSAILLAGSLLYR